ncbi:MAG: type II toxin-antitoxin system Phd/YefM family antitoxin [Thermaerobacter sp.]|nr:type II toxin-antitoxin system Phd/YefM family antitoxin [Thermaerobacter sp.]
MRFVSVRELRSQSAKILGELGLSEVVVTSNGAPVAVLTPVTADSLDLVLRAQRQARAALALVDLQSAAARRGLDRLSGEGITSEIEAARQERKRTE